MATSTTDSPLSSKERDVYILRVCAEQLENYSFHEYGKELRRIADGLGSVVETRAPQNYHCNICGGDVSFPDGAKPSMSIGPGNKTRLRQTDAPDDGSMKGSSQEIKPDCQPWGFQGPIEIGDRFIWMRGTKHQERVRVTQIATVRGDERRVFTARLDVPGEPVVWNDESRFREACERLSENGTGDV